MVIELKNKKDIQPVIKLTDICECKNMMEKDIREFVLQDIVYNKQCIKCKRVKEGRKIK